MNMKARGFKKLIAMSLFAATMLQFSPTAFAKDDVWGATPSNSLDEMAELLNATTYEDYLAQYAAEGVLPFAQSDRPAPIKINAVDFDAQRSEGAVKISDPKGIIAQTDKNGPAYGVSEYVLTGDGDSAIYKVNVPEAGFYNISLSYYPFVHIVYDTETGTLLENLSEDAYDAKYGENEVAGHVEGNTVAIERIIKINNEVPFTEARNIAFTRVWKDEIPEKIETIKFGGVDMERPFRQDKHGNEIRSKKYEDPSWREHVLRDSNAFYTDSFLFYFEEGENSLEIYGSREPVLFGGIEVFVEDKLVHYHGTDGEKGYYELTDGKTSNVTSEHTIKIQAEQPLATSDQVIYPISDKTSSITEPSSTSKTLVNNIGGEKWQIAGQWISYEFTCQESGYYYIIPRAKQATYAGIFASRSLKINGEYPFEEAKYLQFNYSDDWETKPLNDGTTNFRFYFEKGQTYVLEFECVLGNLSDKLRKVDESLTKMNDYYRQILMITGPEPSSFTDYGFQKLIPEVLRGMREEAENLRTVLAQFEEIIGEKGEHSVILDKVAYTLEVMGKDETKIADNLSILKSYVGSIGTWLLQSRNQPLNVDYIVIQGVDEKLPKAEANFFQSMGFEIGSFIMSFFTDYNSYGEMPQEEKEAAEITGNVEVWLTTGRDQAQIMREMVDDFTDATGIAVNYKLVAAGTLLPATLAGIGPDVSTDADPTGFGVRNAVKNIAEKIYNEETGKWEYKYKGFDIVRGLDENGEVNGDSWFSESAWTGLEVYNPDDTTGMNQKATYGIPVTQSFSMLFYRKDIFVELGLEVPETWDDLKGIIQKLSDKNMTIGLSQGMTQILMYQKGEPYYKGEGNIKSIGYATNLDSNIALDSFQQMCEYFSLYGQPISYDFANRFRTGEMPMGIADYSLCNQLLCFAPEIKGLWEFIRLPGSYTYETDEDGKIVTDENGNPVITNFSAVSPSGASSIMIMRDAKNDQEAWEYIKWWVDAPAQERFGKEQVAILGSAGKYFTANKKALLGQPWSAQEKVNLQEQFDNLMGTPMTPGNYIVGRYTNFAFLDVVDDGDAASDAGLYYIDEINKEIERKRKEYDFPIEDELIEMGIIDEDGNVLITDKDEAAMAETKTPDSK